MKRAIRVMSCMVTVASEEDTVLRSIMIYLLIALVELHIMIMKELFGSRLQ